MSESEPIKHYWLYALRLEQGKYYIGITSKKDPNKRIQEHISGFYGAQWTKKYKPIEATQIIDIGNLTHEQAEKLELQRTLQYMKRYGYQNVRGANLNYSGKYVKLGIWYAQRDDFFMLIAVLGLVLCMIGLFLRSR